ncbi:hypothetical protein [Maribacter sp. 2308TA10-17]|uniref:hypothetical protein n=1 Tax=Maribacter sp. 2308TA10-17 TaxID=3386276 RepID=UPI0039BC9D58
MDIKIRVGVTVFCLLLVGCFSNDDGGFGRTVSLNIQDAISMENLKQYNVGDTIFFDLRFSRYLAEEGFDEPVDIFETTKAEHFSFSFDFQKFSELENRFSPINIDEEFVVAEKRDLDTFYYYGGYGTSVGLNEAQDSYETTVGIILVEDGLFRFDFDNIYIQSPYDFEQVQISIYHSFSVDGRLDTEFEVLE